MAKTTRVSDLFQNPSRPIHSIEVFPPKKAEGVPALLEELRKLDVYRPDYISVTYGAGGSTQARSLEVLDKIAAQSDCPTVAHFTCVGTSKEGILEFLNHLKEIGVANILALRGDAPQNDPDFDFSQQAFSYANELIEYLKTVTDMCIAVAGYPEGHTEASNREADWDNCKRKIDAGGELIITQLFLDNADYFAMRDGLAQRGVTAPIEPGLLPIPSLKMFEKIVKMSGCRVPAAYQAIVDKYRDDEDGFRQANIEYSIRQADDLLANGAPGIHWYCLNKADLVSQVLDGLATSPATAKA